MVDFWTALIRGLTPFEKKEKKDDSRQKEQTREKNRD